MKTPGQLDYEEDCRRRPNYDGGAPRSSWEDLPDTFKQAWEKGAKDRQAYEDEDYAAWLRRQEFKEPADVEEENE